MFNTRYQFAVFEEGSHGRIQYTLHETPPCTEDKDKPSTSKETKKTYRGPHLRTLFPQENNTGILDKRAMLVLDVPGLPEANFPSPLESTCRVLENLVFSSNALHLKANLHSVEEGSPAALQGMHAAVIRLLHRC